jgi:hypothetical protein
MGAPQQLLVGAGGGRLTATVTISASTQNYTANTAKVSGYVSGNTDVTFVINAGVVVGSASTGSYAFTVNTSWAAGDTVTVTNAGTVIGRGGNGGQGGASAGTAPAGSSGGPAVSVARTVTWTNTGTCGGGGGGGGGGCFVSTGGGSPTLAGGGGGGGGRGNTGGSGGAGGAPNKSGSGSPGTAGTTTTAGTGGAGEPLAGNGGIGGNGGALGSVGSAGESKGFDGGAGGAGGACLVGKSFVNAGAGITGGTTGGGQT